MAFAPGFRARLEALVRGRGTRSVRREAGGRGLVAGGGFDLVGYRPYRPGEDLRSLDPLLLARTGRPYVRLTRREAGTRWAVVIDTSASMGLGRPGKLQRAAEVAAGLARLGLARGAEVVLVATEVDRGPPALLSRPRDLERGLAWLEGLRAEGAAPLRAAAGRPVLRAAERVALASDLVGAVPSDLRGLARGRRLAVAQVLAPGEVDPPPEPAVLVSPETGAAREVGPDGLRDYARALEAWLESWRGRLSRQGAALARGTTARPFERWIEELDPWT